MAKLGFEFLFRVEASRFTRGIWILWNSSIDVEVLRVHCQYVHMRVKPCSGGRLYCVLLFMVVLRRLKAMICGWSWKPYLRELMNPGSLQEILMLF